MPSAPSIDPHIHPGSTPVWSGFTWKGKTFLFFCRGKYCKSFVDFLHNFSQTKKKWWNIACPLTRTISPTFSDNSSTFRASNWYIALYFLKPTTLPETIHSSRLILNSAGSALLYLITFLSVQTRDCTGEDTRHTTRFVFYFRNCHKYCHTNFIPKMSIFKS